MIMGRKKWNIEELDPIIPTRKLIPVEEVIGKKFGRLTVIEYMGVRKKHNYYFMCKCDCGNETIVAERQLRAGRIRSCGCLLIEKAKDAVQRNVITHNSSNTQLYKVYKRMLQRCYNPNDKRYPRYGERGIKVCQDWQGTHGFETFKEWALTHGYNSELSIDRIDNDKGYSPDNCKWSTQLEQANNRSNNTYLTFNGRTMTIAQWSRELGINKYTISTRLRNGWSIERALTPARRKENYDARRNVSIKKCSNS